MKRVLAGSFATVTLVVLGYFVWPTPWKTFHAGGELFREHRWTGEVQRFLADLNEPHWVGSLHGDLVSEINRLRLIRDELQTQNIALKHQIDELRARQPDFDAYLEEFQEQQQLEAEASDRDPLEQYDPR
ncbi:MAG: hypothetical protein HY319_00215 [Armatimonadetes bacterium]|nr:hypothetical protein [Armatimonadota bacterium]